MSLNFFPNGGSSSSGGSGGTGEGTNNYNELVGKPAINGNTLQGNKTAAQLGLADNDAISNAVSNHNGDSNAHASKFADINAAIASMDAVIDDMGATVGAALGISGRELSLYNLQEQEISNVTLPQLGFVQQSVETLTVQVPVTIMGSDHMAFTMGGWVCSLLENAFTRIIVSAGCTVGAISIANDTFNEEGFRQIIIDNSNNSSALQVGMDGTVFQDDYALNPPFTQTPDLLYIRAYSRMLIEVATTVGMKARIYVLGRRAESDFSNQIYSQINIGGQIPASIYSVSNLYNSLTFRETRSTGLDLVSKNCAGWHFMISPNPASFSQNTTITFGSYALQNIIGQFKWEDGAFSVGEWNAMSQSFDTKFIWCENGDWTDAARAYFVQRGIEFSPNSIVELSVDVWSEYRTEGQQWISNSVVPIYGVLALVGDMKFMYTDVQDFKAHVGNHLVYVGQRGVSYPNWNRLDDNFNLVNQAPQDFVWKAGSDIYFNYINATLSIGALKPITMPIHMVCTVDTAQQPSWYGDNDWQYATDEYVVGQNYRAFVDVIQIKGRRIFALVDRKLTQDAVDYFLNIENDMAMFQYGNWRIATNFVGKGDFILQVDDQGIMDWLPLRALTSNFAVEAILDKREFDRGFFPPTWDNATQYEVGDTVLYHERAYTATQSNRGACPWEGSTVGEDGFPLIYTDGVMSGGCHSSWQVAEDIWQFGTDCVAIDDFVRVNGWYYWGVITFNQNTTNYNWIRCHQQFQETGHLDQLDCTDVPEIRVGFPILMMNNIPEGGGWYNLFRYGTGLIFFEGNDRNPVVTTGMGASLAVEGMALKLVNKLGKVISTVDLVGNSGGGGNGGGNNGGGGTVSVEGLRTVTKRNVVSGSDYYLDGQAQAGVIKAFKFVEDGEYSTHVIDRYHNGVVDSFLPNEAVEFVEEGARIKTDFEVDGGDITPEGVDYKLFEYDIGLLGLKELVL